MNTKIVADKDEIEKIKSRIDDLRTESFDDLLFKINKDIRLVNENVAKLQQERDLIEKKFDNKLSSFNLDIVYDENQIKELNSEKTQAIRSISDIERHIADEIECPSCNHKFCLNNKSYDLKEAKILLEELKKEIVLIDKKISLREESIKDLKKLKADLNLKKLEELNETSLQIQQLKNKISEYETEELEVNKKKRDNNIKISGLQNSIITLENSIKEYQSKIDFNSKQIEALFTRIDTILAQEIKDETTPLLNKIDLINQDLIECLEAKEKLLEEIQILETWRTRFKKFKSYLANSSIEMIESLSNYYLQQMNTHLSVRVDGFKEKADGTLKEEISTEISRDGGVTLESFYKFSGGEKAKIDVSGILAMQKIINMNSSSGGLDLLWIDEIVDSIDRIALSELVSSLSLLNQTILLISHIDLPLTDNIIKVEKKLGISTLTQ